MPNDPAQILDYVESGLKLLLEQFKGQPYFEGLIRSYLNRVQELETGIFEVIESRGIDNSTGVGLDAIGRIVGRARLGLIDSDYRIALRAQIRINRSSGTPEDMIAVTGLSIPIGQVFTYDEAIEATVLIEVQGVAAFNILVLFDNLVRAKAGGVRLLLEFSLFPVADCFTWSDDLTTPTDTHRGWADIGLTVGGYWINVLESGP